ncbi:MAG TPA: hypothetical protein VGT79_11160 [Xanthomonadaceae bacterium]|nr:hypothetical protein [Xanthomonadaceae bacterium]
MRTFLRPLFSGAIFFAVFYLAILLLSPLYHTPTPHESGQTRELFLITGAIGLIGASGIIVVFAALFLAIFCLAFVFASSCWLLLTPKTDESFDPTAGSALRRLRMSAITILGVLTLAMTAVAGYSWHRREQQQTAKREESSVLEFVRNNQSVVQAAGGGTVTVSLSTLEKSHGVVRYEVYVHGDKTIFAIVNVSRPMTGPTFTLACVTPISFGQREAFKDPCSN